MTLRLGGGCSIQLSYGSALAGEGRPRAEVLQALDPARDPPSSPLWNRPAVGPAPPARPGGSGTWATVTGHASEGDASPALLREGRAR